MARQAFVEERVVRADEIEHAPVFRDDALEEQLALRLERVPQIGVELGEEIRIGQDLLQIAQIQPLAGEILDQRFGTLIGEHPFHLRFERRGIAQLAVFGETKQLIVRDAAPEEERQPRGELEIADAVGRALRRLRRIALDAEQEFRIDEDPLHRGFDAVLETAFAASLFVEAHDVLDVRVGDRPAIRAAHQRGDDLLGARRLVARIGGLAGEDARTARRLADAFRAKGAADGELATAGSMSARP